MTRGKSFYAVWDEEANLWSTDEKTVQRLIDTELYKKGQECNQPYELMLLGDFSSNKWVEWQKYVKSLPDNYHELDTEITFANTEVTKEDYVSKRLPYSMSKTDIPNYEELISTLYNPEEREKIEWAIGSIISGDSKKIQKFIVLYGSAGTGKSTIMNIIQQLFDGYYSMFEAKNLASSNNAFALETFKNNPRVAIQHDGDLSRIEDNTKLNSIVSHEEMIVNEKFKSQYRSRFDSFLFMGTNKPVHITDSKSGIIRRLIDVKPSERRIPSKRYLEITKQIKFELGGIAYHCLEVYKTLGINYYDTYIPYDMISATNDFYDFMEDSFETFASQQATTLQQAWKMYKDYSEMANIPYPLSLRKVKEELKGYFKEYEERSQIDGVRYNKVYIGFRKDKFGVFKESQEEINDDSVKTWLSFNSTTSIFDILAADYPAQYASENGAPLKKWDNNTLVLSDLDTTKLHYVKVPCCHIVIDFDLKNEKGEKDYELNLKAASLWPATYAELSKSGAGIHLHYIYDGDVNQLSRIYDENIEIKVFNGNASLRRKLTKCNDLEVATINSGLPLKGVVNVVNFESLKNERAIRTCIKRNLNKEYHGATRPSVDFIFKILEDAYNAGVPYDVTDMRPAIMAFAGNSSHQAAYCLGVCAKMKFKSEEESEYVKSNHDELIFFDVEVFSNLFIVVWKAENKDPVKMINPTPAEIEELVNFKLVGFNNRKYDNHILYARMMGYTNEQLYNLSQRIINDSKNSMFGEAYNLSYTDIYDFASAANKMSLKKWEIKLGIHHHELGLPWDKPVPEELWETVAGYCVDDVLATEAVFKHLSGDFTARKILADLADSTVNDTTNALTTKIIFGNAKHPQREFVYTDLSTIFPGYKYEFGKSSYRGEDPKEGGYVYSEPGMYVDVALLDIASMHPSSIEALNLFGPYTKNFSDIKQARIAIKHKDFEQLKTMLDGKLVKYVDEAIKNDDETILKSLSNALKTAINSVYGLTSAKFDNKFRDPRNIDNIVAKRGALFMINLKHEVQERGFTVAHIKTDSIKIPNATPEIIQFVYEYGKKYGYTFEHEATYDRMCLVNNAVYIARYKDGPHAGEWTATGAQFQAPYVFKTLFSKEPIIFDDLCETKSVKSAIYLDMNEGLPEGEHDYRFIGRIGLFTPVKPGCGGGILLRQNGEKYDSVTGTKGYRWIESEELSKADGENEVDMNYYISLADAAVSDISKYGDFEWFVSNDTEPYDDSPPWDE
jgi:hypothetical protein